MTAGATLRRNARWEVRRLVRSRRAALLIIPPIAGPIGSLIADLYLRIPSTATADILGGLITGGLAALILLDLTALAVGEDLVRRSHLTFVALPEDRRVALAGRLLVAVGGPIVGYLVGAAAVAALASYAVTPTPGALAPLFDPGHLLLAVPGLLLALAGVTAVAAAVTRSSSEGLVAGILAGVVVAGIVAWLVVQREVRGWEPVVLAFGGVIALAVACELFPAAGEGAA